MDGMLIYLLLVSALLNAVVLVFFIQWNKKRQPVGNSDKIIDSMEEFVEKMEKRNEELVWEMLEYAKVRESEFEQRLRAMEKIHEAPVKEAALPETPAPANPAEGIEPLYKQGFSAKQIAKVLKMEYGEVELAINMLNKKKSYQT